MFTMPTTAYVDPVTAHLMGTTEIAAALGVTIQRVGQLRKAYADFPEPVANLAAGPVWNTVDVEAWIKAHPDRPTGRPRKRR